MESPSHATIRGADLVTILNGTSRVPPSTIEITDKDGKKTVVANLEYGRWMSQDQRLLSYLLNSLTSDVLAQVATLTLSAPVWEVLETMYSAQSHTWITNLRMQLATCKKGSMIARTYFS
jgi:hypothetical protein